MRIPGIEIFAILLSLASLPLQCQVITPEACLEFAEGSCARCRRDTHLYDGACYKNIIGCIVYSQGTSCKTCQSKSFALSGELCSIIAGTNPSTDLEKYSGEEDENPGDQYGSASFISTSMDVVGGWRSFVALDEFVRKGEYSHYISRVSKPVYSVHYYQQGQTYSFKVVYYGSGGGLFLCIADVPPSLKVELRSLTPISASSVVSNCYDYDTSGRCIGCRIGHHLETGVCYPNYGGCLKYFENICLECVDYYLLVENRCVSDCLSSSDAKSILFYGTRTVSTLEVKYTISISRFYWAQTSQTIASLAQQSLTKNAGNSTRSLASTTMRVQPVNSSTVSTLSSISIVPSNSYQNSNLTASLMSSLSQSSLSPPSPNLKTTNASNWLKTSPNLVANALTTSFHSNSQVYCSIKNNDGSCLKCIEHYFLNENAECQEVSLLCVSVEESTGMCTRCFTGYSLNLGRCEFKSSH